MNKSIHINLNAHDKHVTYQQMIDEIVDRIGS